MIEPVFPIRPIGPRVLVRPIPCGRDESNLIEALDEPPITQGDVLAVGHPHCEDCGGQIRFHLRSQMRVLLRPSALVQELEFGGETLWMVLIDDVVGEVEPVATP